MEGTTQVLESPVNGLDVVALARVVEDIKADPSKAAVAFKVTTDWTGQTRSRATVSGYSLGGQWIDRDFAIDADEPFELLGSNTAPNPQELLMSALNACIMVGYVAGAAIKGITLDSVRIETEGALDLRGFLGIDETVKPGYDSVRYTVRLKGDGTLEEYRQIHETVMKTSPNYFNIAKPVRIESELVVES